MVGRVDYDVPHPAPHIATDIAPVASVEFAGTLMRRVSWGAVLAGIVISLMVHLLLNMLGVGVGAAVVDPQQPGGPDAASVSITAAIWWAVAGILAAFAGGWIAARLSGSPHRSTGLWHGLVTWAATTLVVLWLVTGFVGTVVGSAFGMAGNLLGALGQAAPQAVGQMAGGQEDGALGGIADQFRQIIDATPTDRETTARIDDALRAALADDPTPEEREAAIQLFMEQGGMTRPQAENQLAEWRSALQQGMGQVAETAEAAAEATTTALSATALYGFVALILGAIAGAIGGRLGAPRDLADYRI